MNTKLIKLAISILVAIFLIVVTFGLFAFSEWSVNPESWSGDCRFGFSLISAAIFVVAMLAQVIAED